MTVTAVEFTSSLTAGGDDGPAKFAAKHIVRTLGHLDKVDVGALVTAYMAMTDAELNPHSCKEEPDFIGAEILRITALVETVLDEGRKAIRLRMALDVASNLLPRLIPKEH